MKKLILILLTLLALTGCGKTKEVYNWDKGDFLWTKDFATESILVADEGKWLKDIEYGDEFVSLYVDGLNYSENIDMKNAHLSFYANNYSVNMSVSEEGNKPYLSITDNNENKTIEYTFDFKGNVEDVARYSYPEGRRIYDEELTINMDAIANIIGKILSSPKGNELFNKFLDADKFLTFLVENENMDANKIEVKPFINTNLVIKDGFDDGNDYFHTRDYKMTMSANTGSSYKNFSVRYEDIEVYVYYNEDAININLKTNIDKETYEGLNEYLIVKDGKAYYSPYYYQDEKNPEEGFEASAIADVLDKVSSDEEASEFFNRYFDLEEFTRIILELN